MFQAPKKVVHLFVTVRQYWKGEHPLSLLDKEDDQYWKNTRYDHDHAQSSGKQSCLYISHFFIEPIVQWNILNLKIYGQFCLGLGIAHITHRINGQELNRLGQNQLDLPCWSWVKKGASNYAFFCDCHFWVWVLFFLQINWNFRVIYKAKIQSLATERGWQVNFCVVK